MNRRDFLKTTGERAFGLLLFGGLHGFANANTKATGLPDGWLNPQGNFHYVRSGFGMTIYRKKK